MTPFFVTRVDSNGLHQWRTFFSHIYYVIITSTSSEPNQQCNMTLVNLVFFARPSQNTEQLWRAQSKYWATVQGPVKVLSNCAGSGYRCKKQRTVPNTEVLSATTAANGRKKTRCNWWVWVNQLISTLVGGFNPSEKYSSVGMIIPNIWKIMKNHQNVPSHQPEQNTSRLKIPHRSRPISNASARAKSPSC